jgi:hypothetical protein
MIFRSYLRQQVSVQAIYDFLLQHNNKLLCVEAYEFCLDWQAQADQPNSLSEGSLM